MGCNEPLSRQYCFDALAMRELCHCVVICSQLNYCISFILYDIYSYSIVATLHCTGYVGVASFYEVIAHLLLRVSKSLILCIILLK